MTGSSPARLSVPALAAAFAVGIAVGGLAFGRDPWTYGTQKDTAVPVRYNRQTGESQILRSEGWEKLDHTTIVQFVPDPR